MTWKWGEQTIRELRPSSAIVAISFLSWLLVQIAGANSALGLDNPGPGNRAPGERRLALVIGNSDYEYVAHLSNPSNDARLIADTLRGLGFTLVGGKAQIDLDKPAFERAVQKFGEQLSGSTIALFYYAGHGMQLQGANYLVPISANPTKESDVNFQMENAQWILDEMQDGGAKFNVVILDACRNNPFGGRSLRGSSAGLAQMQAPEGTLISYATAPGSVASDGDGRDSPFTESLVEAIREPGLDILHTFNEVAILVKQKTGGEQKAWTSNSAIEGDFYFTGNPGIKVGARSGGAVEDNAPAKGQDELAKKVEAELAEAQAERKKAAAERAAVEKELADARADRKKAAVEQRSQQQGAESQEPKPVQLADLKAPDKIPRPSRISINTSGSEMPHVQQAPVDEIAGLYDRVLHCKDQPCRKGFLEAVRLDHIKQMAFSGNYKAQFLLAVIYLRGWSGVSQSPAQAFSWMRKAAEQGNANAQFALGNLYETGSGVEKDEAEALNWKNKAALQDPALFASSLAFKFFIGEGVERNYSEAAKWFRKAAVQGNADAQNMLGHMYYEGIGVEKDPAEALKWYRKAAAQKDDPAHGSAQAWVNILSRR